MNGLHVYAVEDAGATNWYVAKSKADARGQHRALTGDWSGDLTVERWADDRKLTVTDYDAAGRESVTKTCREWADSTGRDVLCSTEY